MSIYRVIVSFMRENLQFMSERGALAMTPGQALDSVLSNLQIDHSRINNFKAWTQKPESMSEFSEDALMMQCLGDHRSVRDAWLRRHHG